MDARVGSDTMSTMALFRRAKKQRVFGVVDVGSDTIKALLFAVPRAGSAADVAVPLPKLPGASRHDTSGTVSHEFPAFNEASNPAAGPARGTVLPLEKFVWDLPEQYTGVRLARKIREGVFRMVQYLEGVPERIFIAAGPTVAECALRTWRVAPARVGSGKTVMRRDLRAAYHELMLAEADMRRAVIATPVDVMVNGYSLPVQLPSRGDAVLPRALVRDVAFRTLSLYLPLENGATFGEIRQSLGGMPIEFLPLAVAHTEAVAGRLGMRDALVVDVGGDETSVIAVRGARLAHAAFLPYGARGFAERLRKQAEHSFAGAQKEMRLRAQTGTLGPVADAAAASAAAVAAGRWKELFVSSLESFAASGPLPADLLLAGGGAHFPEVRAALASSDWMGGVSHALSPRLAVMNGALLFGGDTLGGYLTGPEDAGLASLAVYATMHRPIF